MRVRFYGQIGRLNGYGRAAADLCMSLLATGEVDLEISPIGQVPAEEARLALERYQPLRSCLRHDHELTAPDVVILHRVPLDCPKAMRLVLDHEPGLDPDIPWVAYTTWEGYGTAPMAVRMALVDFDQVWTPSWSSCDSLANPPNQPLLADRCKIIPHAFDPAELDERRGGQRGGNDGLRFYYSGAWTSRKNPAGLLRAWAMAFDRTDPVRLLIHSPGASKEAFIVAQHQTGLAAQDMAPVHFAHDPLPYAEYLSLHRDCDVFVTATRGEAWNLPAFDAVLAGRHVIHPRSMGSDDYLRHQYCTADLYGGMAMPATVDVAITERTAAGIKMSVVGAQGLTSRSQWLEPNLFDLANIMQRVAREGRTNIELGYDPVERFSYSAVGKTALSALEEL